MLAVMNIQSWSDYWLNWVNSASNIIGIIGAGFVLISVAFIYFTGTELTRRAKYKEGLATQEEQKKTHRLAQAEADLVIARKAADEAKELASALEEKQRPRTISEEQRKRFIAFMAPIEKGKVSLKSLASDNESLAFALLLKSMLVDSGCDVVGEITGFISLGAPASGIQLKIKDKDSPPIHAGNVQKAFEHIGIQAPCSIEQSDNPLDKDTLTIYVYGKN
jgi:hypothetical protein